MERLTAILDGFGHGVGSVNKGIKRELDFGCRGIQLVSLQKLEEAFWIHLHERHITIRVLHFVPLVFSKMLTDRTELGAMWLRYKVDPSATPKFDVAAPHWLHLHFH